MAGQYRIVRTDILGGNPVILEPFITVDQSVIVTMDIPPPGDYVYHMQYLRAPVYEGEVVSAAILTLVNVKR